MTDMADAGNELELAGSIQGSDIVPYATVRSDVRTFMSITPPETGAKIQDVWIKVITPFRATLVALMWLTEFWWRVAISIALVSAIIALFWLS